MNVPPVTDGARVAADTARPGPGAAPAVAPAALGSLTETQRLVLRRLLRDARAVHGWSALGAAVQAHVRAGVRLEKIAAVLQLGVPRVREIRRRHSDYDPATDRGVARQVGQWGSIAAAAGAAGTTVSTLSEHLADAAAAGVTRLYGQRRLWHAPATATWWAGVAAAADARSAAVAEVRRDRVADVRGRHAAGRGDGRHARGGRHHRPPRPAPGRGLTVLRAGRMSGSERTGRIGPGRCSPVRSVGEAGGAS